MAGCIAVCGGGGEKGIGGEEGVCASMVCVCGIGVCVIEGE